VGEGLDQADERRLPDLKTEILGRKAGALTQILGRVPQLDPASRKEVGGAANALKREFEAAFDARERALGPDHPELADYLNGLASVLAEHHLTGPVIGVAFDGTGSGGDGTVWGGEFLVARYGGFERYDHVRYFPLAGGDAAVHEPWRAAAASPSPA